ncbi:resistance to inhibitors of cholinesterase protein 3-like isoform X1 [Dreissena polymorpha]|uniref:resistance to inhibitors of cholinesterase protein 3-like isoform X1 n=1 Tax=Dreissena polymorpha TaxID=45954 RepID=UPI00226457FA|nr:resistance to inhibitors of cholinesterase protein 3-like isoform X1 [Dreissena polymorpha]
MDFQTFRIYGSMAVILGCFIFLYPKLLHPLILTMFGMHEQPGNSRTEDMLPPSLRGQHPHLASQQDDVHENIKKMRHGPHPGMRAAAAEQAKQTKGSSGRGGMMGVVLPMYAIGIVVYLVYTLVKVFGKKNNKSKSDQRSSPTRGQETPQQSDTPEGEEGRVSPDALQRQLKKLQAFSSSLQDNEMKGMDMRKLQERLAETEAQMSKILQAMQSVQNKMGDVTAPSSSTNQNASAAQKAEDGQNVNDIIGSSTESTPDSESYEIVNKSDRESSGEEQEGSPLETLGSKTREEENNDDETKNDAEKEEEGDCIEEVLLDDISKPSEVDTTVRKRLVKAEDTVDS